MPPFTIMHLLFSRKSSQFLSPNDGKLSLRALNDGLLFSPSVKHHTQFTSTVILLIPKSFHKLNECLTMLPLCLTSAYNHMSCNSHALTLHKCRLFLLFY